LAGVAQVVERAAGVLFSTNPELLGNLRPDDKILEQVGLDFVKMLDDRRFKVFSFQEAKGLSPIAIGPKKVRILPLQKP
jgi:hypothetical protein